MEDQEQTLSENIIEQPKKENPGSFKNHPENINRGGRSRYTESVTAWYRTFLIMQVEDFLAWEKNNPNPPVAAAIAYAGMVAARTGLKDRREVTDRTDGKPKQVIDVDLNANIKQSVTNKELADSIKKIMSEESDSYEEIKPETPENNQEVNQG